MFETIFASPFRRKRVFLTTWFLVAGSVVLVTIFTTPLYRSEAKLFVRLGRENSTLDPTAAIGQGTIVTPPPSRETELNSVVEMLRSRALAQRVVDSLSPGYFLNSRQEGVPGKATATAASISPESTGIISTLLGGASPRENAIKKFTSKLGVINTKKTNLISVTFEAASPEKAQRIVQTLIDAYLDVHSHINRTPRSFEFLSEQAREVRGRLKEAEERLRQQKNSASLASIEEQRLVLERRLGGLKDQVFAAEASLSATRREISALDATLSTLPGTLVSSKVEGHPNPAADLVRQQLYALEVEEKSMSSKFTAEHPRLKQIRRQVEEAKAIAALEHPDRTQVTTATNPSFEQLKLTRLTAIVNEKAVNSKIHELERQIAKTEDNIVALNNQAVQIVRLEREVAILEASDRRFAESLEETRLDQAVQNERLSNVSLAQEPSLEFRAARPQKLLNYSMGFVFATLASVALVAFLELRNPHINSLDQLERELNSPAFVAIPRNVREVVTVRPR